MKVFQSSSLFWTLILGFSYGVPSLAKDRTSCEHTLAPVKISDAARNHIFNGDIVLEKVLVPTPAENPKRLEMQIVPVIAGGLHTWDGFQRFLAARENSGNPLPHGLVSQGDRPQNFKVLHNGKSKTVEIPTYYLEGQDSALVAFLPRQALSFKRKELLLNGPDTSRSFGYPLTLFPREATETQIEKWIKETACSKDNLIKKTSSGFLIYERMFMYKDELLRVRVILNESREVITSFPIVEHESVEDILVKMNIFHIFSTTAVSFAISSNEAGGRQRIERFREVMTQVLMLSLENKLDLSAQINEALTSGDQTAPRWARKKFEKMFREVAAAKTKQQRIALLKSHFNKEPLKSHYIAPQSNLRKTVIEISRLLASYDLDEQY